MDLVVKNKNYMIFELNKSMTRDNRPYIRSVVIDKEGNQYQGIMFDSNKLDFDPEKGSVVAISGTIQNYNGQMQLKISEMSHVDGDDYYDFLPKSKRDEGEMFAELQGFMAEHLKNPFLIQLLDQFMNDTETIAKFRKMPAAKTVHHAYVSGLLEHTLSVVKLAKKMCDPYAGLVNEDMVLIGALFHDVGKVVELDVSKGFDYTMPGKLMGHMVLGIEMISRYMNNIPNFPLEEKYILQHMIASHHGITDFGAIKKPKTVEALILHHADDLDAKINTFHSIFEKEDVESGWSSYDRLLERQIYRYI